MNIKKKESRNPWSWIPSLYFAQGIPYIVVMSVSVIMYKRMGISNTEIALYTSWLYLPYTIKPLWSPLVDILKTKRIWIIIMQLIVGAGLAGVALTIPAPDFLRYTLIFFWLVAFSSATHDIAADGFYMLGMSKHDQAFFIGIRSTFYRIAMITGQGLLVILVGYLESATGLQPVSINVNPASSSSTQIILDSDSALIKELDGDLRIVANSNNVTISPTPVHNSELDSVISMANNLNSTNGFYDYEKTESEITAHEEVIRKTKESDQNYSYGIIYFHLSKKPEADEKIIMTFGFEEGNKNIFLGEGNKFVFTDNNWNKPAYAVFLSGDNIQTEISAATFEARAGNIPMSWIISFSILACMFFLFAIYHYLILPYPKSDRSAVNSEQTGFFSEFIKTFVLFFKKKNIGIIIAFLLLYRFGESQLVKLASPFLLDSRELGGLGLTTSEVGIVYGTVGMLALLAGGLLGGFLASKHGLKKWLWWMVLAINIPNTVYIFLSYAQPDSFIIVNIFVAIEQFGYGFGFTAYMLYMIYVSDGTHKTAHFAITTAFMALGMMIPGMFSGWLQEMIGYQNFFVWAVIATIPAFIVTKFIPLDSSFGMKNE